MGRESATYLARVARRTREHLGDEVLGVYATGSWALGDFVAGRSDLDVLVVAGGPAAEARLRALAHDLDHEHLPVPARLLEYVVYPAEEARRPAPAPRWLLNLNTGPTGTHVGLDPAAEPAHWFVIDLAITARHGVALHGPPAAELIGTPSPEAVRAALEQALDWYRGHGDAAEAVLSACRAEMFAATGRWGSKTEAAAWALKRGADREPIEDALARRHGLRRTTRRPGDASRM